jgi:hypothetical protein
MGGQIESGPGSLWAHVTAGLTVLAVIFALYAPLVL